MVSSAGPSSLLLVPRRPPSSGKNVPRKAKGHKRPREYHHGRAAGKINEAVLVSQVEPEFARAEADRAESARVSSAHRALVRDYEGLLAGLARVSPCARSPLPLVLL